MATAAPHRKKEGGVRTGKTIRQAASLQQCFHHGEQGGDNVWGLGDAGVFLAYLGSILAAIFCFVWGVRYWNKDV